MSRFTERGLESFTLPKGRRTDESPAAKGYRAGRAGEPRVSPFKRSPKVSREWLGGYDIGKQRRES